jgi:ABC-type bacteriocin/lantibiotic exporter with double-glycine peptidase domain
VISAFEPVAVEAEYPAPRAEIAPDKTLGWVRRLLPLLWSRWRLFAASLGSSVANALIGPAMILLVGHIIDHAIYPPEGGVREPVGPLVALLAGLGLTQLGFGYLSGVLTSRTNQSIEYDLRTRTSARCRCSWRSHRACRSCCSRSRSRSSS